MTVDIPSLAREITIFLLPALPYLIKWVKVSGIEAAKSLGVEIGKEIPATIKSLYKKLWSKTENDPISRGVLEKAAAKPTDKLVKDALVAQLTKLIENDAKFRSEIKNLFDMAKKEAPDLSIFSNIEVVDGEVVGLNVTNGDALHESGIKTIQVEQEVKKVSKSGKLTGAEFGKAKTKSS